MLSGPGSARCLQNQMVGRVVVEWLWSVIPVGGVPPIDRAEHHHRGDGEGKQRDETT
jgi:hypothetical protein